MTQAVCLDRPMGVMWPINISAFSSLQSLRLEDKLVSHHPSQGGDRGTEV
jgi:hypothetical protein